MTRWLLTAALIATLSAAPPAAAAPQRPPAECDTPEDCRERGLAAAAAGEYERFHDFAWRAVQKGSPNDPEWMALLARAQSLSGRPHDALVMLRRLADMGVLVDEAATSDDFRRVRALPGWPPFEARLSAAAPPAAATSERTSEAATAPGTRARAVRLPPILELLPRLLTIPGSRAPRPAAPALPSAARATNAPAVPDAGADRAVENALHFSTLPFEPAGLVYDAVSARFILGNRGERKLSVIGERSGRLTNLVGEDSAGFGDVEAIAIDAHEGDLWVASTPDGAGPRLHKLQLISGRLLFTVEVQGAPAGARLTDIAVAPDGAVLALDAPNRRLLRLAPGTREPVLVGTLDVTNPVSLAYGPGGQLYVASTDGISRLDGDGRVAGALKLPDGIDAAQVTSIRAHGAALIVVERTGTGRYRLARIALAANGRRASGVDVLEEDAPLAGPSAVAVAGDSLFYLVRDDGFTATGGLDLTIRRVALPR